MLPSQPGQIPPPPPPGPYLVPPYQPPGPQQGQPGSAPYPPRQAQSGGYPNQQAQPAPYPGLQAQSAPYPAQQVQPGGPYPPTQEAQPQAQQQLGAYAWPPQPGYYPYTSQPAGYPVDGPYPPAQGAYGGVPPQQQPPRRRGLKIALVAAVALILAAGGTGLVLILNKGDSPTTMARKAAQAIDPAAGLKLSGTIGGAPASVTVTKAGTVEGTYRQSGHRVSRVTIDGNTYLNAPTNFWRANFFNTRSSEQAGGHWARAPKRTVSISFDALRPHRIAQVLEHVGDKPDVEHTSLHGSKVIRLTERGATYFITEDAPHRLLRVNGNQGKTPYSFDVRPLTGAAIKPTFEILANDVSQFKGAPDPGAIVLPDGKIKFDANCKGSVSCTVVSKVTVSDPDAKVILLKMTVEFAGSETGNSFATCSTMVVANEVTTVQPSCGVRGSVWTNWFDSHVGNFSTWARPHFEATVNSATDVTNLQSLLTQEQESG
jgi:hypothetical protein